jgi:hypothetical protein
MSTPDGAASPASSCSAANVFAAACALVGTRGFGRTSMRDPAAEDERDPQDRRLVALLRGTTPG